VGARAARRLRLADETSTRDLGGDDLPRAVLASFGGSPRFKRIAESLVRHLHAFASEVDPRAPLLAVFGVRSSPISLFERHEPGTAPDGKRLDVPFWTLAYDLVLAHKT
jgi:hypothetical protein